MNRAPTGWLLCAVWMLLTTLAAADPGVEHLRRGFAAEQSGQLAGARHEYLLALQTATHNYLRLEADTRLAKLLGLTTREGQQAAARAVALFDLTPPRWLSDDARKLLAETAYLAGGRPGPLPPRALDFSGRPAGSGFPGKRYLWMAHLAGIPPAASPDASGHDWQDDEDRLPQLRVQFGRRWAVVDPWHARPEVRESDRARWRFDRCLVGYTFEPVEQHPNFRGVPTWQPLEPWYDVPQWQVWRQRVRVYYPSAAMGAQQDYQALAENLLDALLRANWLGREEFGRDVVDAQRHGQVLSVWLTENPAEQLSDAGAERWFDNLYFYRIDQSRAPGEWLREAVHEYGHAMMPRLGMYVSSSRYETWLEGPLGERLLLRGLAQRPVTGGGSAWLDEFFALDLFPGYERSCWTPLVASWLRSGPNAAQRYGKDDPSADWILGFVLWLAETHQPAFLRDYLSRLSAGSQLGADDWLKAYESRVADWLREGRPLELASRPVSRTSDTAPEPADGGLALTPETEVEYQLWLPERALQVRLFSNRRGVVMVQTDGGGARAVETGDETTAPATPLAGQGRWQTITVRGVGEQPVELTGLEVRGQ